MISWILSKNKKIKEKIKNAKTSKKMSIIGTPSFTAYHFLLQKHINGKIILKNKLNKSPS